MSDNSPALKRLCQTGPVKKIKTISASNVTAQYRTAGGSDRMLPLYSGTVINDELNLGSGRYRSRFCIEGRPVEAR